MKKKRYLMRNPVVRCPTCKGDGEVRLPKLMVKLMVWLREGPMTAGQVYRRLLDEGLTKSYSPSAANNLLEKLRKNHFVDREHFIPPRKREGDPWYQRDGWIYRLKKPKRNQYT